MTESYLELIVSRSGIKQSFNLKLIQFASFMGKCATKINIMTKCGMKVYNGSICQGHRALVVLVVAQHIGVKKCVNFISSTFSNISNDNKIDLIAITSNQIYA